MISASSFCSLHRYEALLFACLVVITADQAGLVRRTATLTEHAKPTIPAMTTRISASVQMFHWATGQNSSSQQLKLVTRFFTIRSNNIRTSLGPRLSRNGSGMVGILGSYIQELVLIRRIVRRAPIWVMRAVVILEALWLALVLFLFNFKLPISFMLLFGTWATLFIALYLFSSQKRVAAPCLSYVAVIAGAFLMAFGGSGPPHFTLSSFYRDVPNLTFLISAHFAYKKEVAEENL